MPFSDRAQYNLYMKDYVLARYHKRRDEAIVLLGGECVTCGSTEALEFDHVDPLTKDFPISKLWSVSRQRFLKELAKCQLLCYDCHLKKSSGPNGDISRKMHMRS